MCSQRTDPNDPNDPKGLIRESYRIEGISSEQCRSIFLDWVLSLSSQTPYIHAVTAVLARYAPHIQDKIQEKQELMSTVLAHEHPMTILLWEALHSPPTSPKRRNGARER